MIQFGYWLSNASPHPAFQAAEDPLDAMLRTLAAVEAIRAKMPVAVPCYVDPWAPAVYLVDNRKVWPANAWRDWVGVGRPEVYMVGSANAYGGLMADCLAAAYWPEAVPEQ